MLRNDGARKLKNNNVKFSKICTHTHIERLLFKLHTHSQWQQGEAQFSPSSRFSLSWLWSAIDALFLLTTSHNSERRNRVFGVLKTQVEDCECEFELQSSTRLWFNESLRTTCVCLWGFQLCVHPSVLHFKLSSRVAFSRTLGDTEYSDSIIDRFHWMICLH